MQLKVNLKKFILYTILFAAIFYGIFFLTAQEMPKYRGFMFSFLLFILADFYVWSYYKKYVVNKVLGIKIILFCLYWLSLILSFTFFISSFVSNIKDWSAFYRTYLTGLMFVVYVPKLFMAGIILLCDLIRFSRFIIAFLFKRSRFTQKFKNKRPAFLLYSGNIVSIFIITILCYGMIFNAFDFEIKKVNITSAKLPDSFKGFRIVQISDLHLGSIYNSNVIEKLIDKTNNLNPDIVLFTGDMFNYSTKESNGFENILKKIQSKNGVYAILGNHDYGDYVKWESKEAKEKNMIDLEEFYRNCGWILLRNENAKIYKDSSFINIIGVENWGKDPRFQKMADMTKALKNIDTSAFNILLSHDPSHFDMVISKEYPFINLTLSGHTHAMQMGISTDDFEWSPAKFLYKYWGGLYQTNQNQYIHVNRGSGVLGYPGRIGIKPEITLIVLN